MPRDSLSAVDKNIFPLHHEYVRLSVVFVQIRCSSIQQYCTDVWLEEGVGVLNGLIPPCSCGQRFSIPICD
jgi:hypothetical protein